MPSVMLPYPISVNVAYRNFRGNMVKSAKAREYQSKVAALVHQEGSSEPLSGAIHVEMIYHPIRPKKWKEGTPTRSMDLDNVMKVTIDSLNGVAWVDDKQITFLSIAKGTPIDNGGVSVNWRET